MTSIHIPPGAVSTRISNFEPDTHHHSLHHRKHSTDLNTNQSYRVKSSSPSFRSRLRHVSPQRRAPKRRKTFLTWPVLKHWHRNSIVHTNCPIRTDFSPVVMAPVYPRDGDVPFGLRLSSDVAHERSGEIGYRRDSRPWIRHGCGHEEQVVVMSLKDDESGEFVLERGKDGGGGGVLVGPVLREAVDKVDGRVVRVDGRGREVIIPIECSACEEARVRGGRRSALSFGEHDVAEMRIDEDDILTSRADDGEKKVFVWNSHTEESIPRSYARPTLEQRYDETLREPFQYKPWHPSVSTPLSVEGNTPQSYSPSPMSPTISAMITELEAAGKTTPQIGARHEPNLQRYPVTYTSQDQEPLELHTPQPSCIVNLRHIQQSPPPDRLAPPFISEPHTYPSTQHNRRHERKGQHATVSSFYDKLKQRDQESSEYHHPQTFMHAEEGTTKHGQEIYHRQLAVQETKETFDPIHQQVPQPTVYDYPKPYNQEDPDCYHPRTITYRRYTRSTPRPQSTQTNTYKQSRPTQQKQSTSKIRAFKRPQNIHKASNLPNLPSFSQLNTQQPVQEVELPTQIEPQRDTKSPISTDTLLALHGILTTHTTMINQLLAALSNSTSQIQEAHSITHSLLNSPTAVASPSSDQDIHTYPSRIPIRTEDRFERPRGFVAPATMEKASHSEHSMMPNDFRNRDGQVRSHSATHDGNMYESAEKAMGERKKIWKAVDGKWVRG